MSDPSVDLTSLQALEDLLRKPFDVRDVSLIGSELAARKSAAVQAGDQPVAKHLWCLQQALAVQEAYLAAFAALKAERFHDAWLMLDNAEQTLFHLTPHFSASERAYGLDFIRRYVRETQKIFPYALFQSPEIIEHETRCSVCQKTTSIRHPCGHVVGEIYDGEICARVVTKMEIVGVAFVKTPLQKSSVPFLVDDKTGKVTDHYDYSLIRYLARRWREPFHNWTAAWSKRRMPHARFGNVGRNDPCPCESGRKYKKCCALEDGVLRPHCEFVFEVPPSVELLKTEFTGR